MSNIIIPLRFSPLPMLWLLLSHAGAILCLSPMGLAWPLHLSLVALIGASFVYQCQRQRRLRVFHHLEWRADSKAWFLSDRRRLIECQLTLKPGGWLNEHVILLSFFAKELSGKISLWFAFDQYSPQELQQLRRTILHHQHFLK